MKPMYSPQNLAQLFLSRKTCGTVYIKENFLCIYFGR